MWIDEAARHGVDFALHGPQFSRGFAALKVWVSLLAHGRAAYGRRIAHDVALARYLGQLVERLLAVASELGQLEHQRGVV